jgi:hypothetical protein
LVKLSINSSFDFVQQEVSIAYTSRIALARISSCGWTAHCHS